jgi:hypothetical protein
MRNVMVVVAALPPSLKPIDPSPAISWADGIADENKVTIFGAKKVTPLTFFCPRPLKKTLHDTSALRKDSPVN